ncbi:MAG: fimbrial biogenesis outer membrane usher protein [Hyphomicrobiaceae bacterium]|nr:fimbrial biogenesis outer membrane usher protein [Hyphomicrobiaceae bacterium]
MPLLDDDRKLGEIVARIDPDDRIWVPRNILIDMLGDAIKPEAAQKIRKLPDTGGQIEITSLAVAGVTMVFDKSQVALVVVPRADMRTTQTISLQGPRTDVVSASLARPALWAGFLNITGGIDHLWDADGQPARTGGHLQLQSALRFGSVVLEADGTYDGDVDPQVCPRDAYCAYEHVAGFKRRRTRFVLDRPEDALRFQAGDAFLEARGFQRISDVAGIVIEKAPAHLQPDSYGRATSNQTFLLERPSLVAITVNGLPVRQLRLRPGIYDLRDLALITGSNHIRLDITDETGTQHTIERTTYFDRMLLRQGATEWSIGAGAPSYSRDGEREYADNEYSASGSYRIGLFDRLTGEMNGQSDSNVTLAGVGLFAGTPWGFLGLQGAISHADVGDGIAVNASWDLVNFRGLRADSGAGRESLRLAAEYRSPDFRQPGDFLTTASGLFYPQVNYWLRLSASYSLPIAWGLSATLAGRYQLAIDEPIVTNAPVVTGDRFGADLMLSGALTDRISGSVTIGYSNETTIGYLPYQRLPHQLESPEPEVRFMARAFVRLGSTTNVVTSYDTLNRQALTSAYSAIGTGLDRWETTVDAYADGRGDTGTVGGSLAYYGNRLEARLEHGSAVGDLSWTAVSRAFDQQRTTVRLGTALVFADGHVAVGAPVRGNAFAIVYPHESLAGKPVTVGADGNVRARTDALGAAVVTDLPAYTTTSLPIDVEDLPVGYSLGAGAFDVRPPFRGGYALEVGSGNSVSAYGTLLGPNDAPLALLAGTAFPADKPQQQVGVLTNSAGRFSAEGLAPGRWTIEMATEAGIVRYALEVPKGTDGLLRAGTLKPVTVTQMAKADGSGEASGLDGDGAGAPGPVPGDAWSTRVSEAPRSGAAQADVQLQRGP